jgi:RNA polymerase sigma-70 factor, ECF subfamily
MNDSELIARIALQESGALCELMGRFRSITQRRILGIVRDASAAEDLTQETFLRVWTRAAQFEGGDGAAGWIGRIATNLALNHLRATRRRPAESMLQSVDDDQQESVVDMSDRFADPDAVDPLDLADARELEHHLHSALDEMPEAKRLVQEMVVDGTELAAVAEELGIPLGTAKSRLYYSRKHLAEVWRRLAQQWEDT